MDWFLYDKGLRHERVMKDIIMRLWSFFFFFRFTVKQKTIRTSQVFIVEKLKLLYHELLIRSTDLSREKIPGVWFSHTGYQSVDIESCDYRTCKEFMAHDDAKFAGEKSSFATNLEMYTNWKTWSACVCIRY